MKNTLIYFLFSLLFLIGIQSCDIENINNNYITPYGYWQPYTTNSSGQYVIGGYINGQQSRTITRAELHSGAGASYDNFALYTWTADSVVMNGYHGIFSGNTWGYTENVKYFDNFVPEYNFIGIIPQDADQSFNNGIVTVKAKSFSVENENMAGYTDTEEVLYATANVEKENYANGASFEFNHINSKVYLKFTSNDPNTQIIDYSPVVAETSAIPEQKDTVDTWISLNRSSNTVGSASKTRINTGGTWGDFTNAYALPINLIKEIKSYYSIDGGTPGDYDLHMGASVWPSGTIKQLRVVKAIPAQYKLTVELYNTGVKMDFFDGFKYLKDNGYDIQASNSGGKPDVFNYILLDAFENGSAYTVVGFNYGAPSSIPKYTINIIPGQPAVPASGVANIVVLPATSTIGDGTDAELSTYPDSMNVNISLNGISYETISTNNTFTFTKPEGKISTEKITSPTTWYTFASEANEVNNVGYTIKFSFIYKGVTVYDARVFLPANHCQWEPGKYYTYVININGRGNGHDTVVDPNAIDPQITNPTNNEIIVNTTSINPYTNGEEHEYTIQ